MWGTTASENVKDHTRRRAYLRSAPGEAHLRVLAGLCSESGQARGHGVLRPSRCTEIPDLTNVAGRSVPGVKTITGPGMEYHHHRPRVIAPPSVEGYLECGAL